MSSPHLFFSFVQVKSKIIQQLSAIPVETVARVQQVSNVIASASSVIDEVTVEAQVILLVTRHCFAITLGSHSFLKSKVNGLLIHSLNFFFLQKDATDSLVKMTSVLKAESTAGERYDSLFDGAKSLVTGLASMLRVVSHGARVYGWDSQVKSHIEAKFFTADQRLSRKSRRVKFRSRTSLPYLLAMRTKRDAYDAHLQVKNHSKPR